MRRYRFLSDQSGSMLVMVVFMTVLLSIIAISFGSSTLSRLSLMDRLQTDLKSYALARSAVPFLRHHLNEDESEAYDGLAGFRDREEIFRNHRLGEGTFSVSYDIFNPYSQVFERKYGVLDEESKLNLNTAPSDTLKNLFLLTTDLTEEEAEAIADSLLDWRDEDTEPGPRGAEKMDYASMRPSYAPKDGKFESVEEALLVKGMTPELYEKARPYLTVYGSGAVNVNTAHKITLLSLGLSETGVNGILMYRAGPDGQTATEDDGVIQDQTHIAAELSGYVLLEDMSRIHELLAKAFLDVKSEAFSFISEGAIAGEPFGMRIRAVMNRGGEILSWAEE